MITETVLVKAPHEKTNTLELSTEEYAKLAGQVVVKDAIPLTPIEQRPKQPVTVDEYGQLWTPGLTEERYRQLHGQES